VRWREHDGVRSLEAELPGARACFTTRIGGVSDGPFESLNLGLLTGDERDAVRENRHRAARAAGVDPEAVLIGHQVHGTEIAHHEVPLEANQFAEPGPSAGDADGHVTSVAGLAPLVFVADCLPIALAGPGGVAIVHGGWRGLAGGIVERGAEAVAAEAAAVGPGIGPCCYEVGDEVREVFEPLGSGIAAGRMLDLGEIARRLLERAGVGEIESSDLCTSCNPELLFSHRRDGGETGRQAGLVVADG
jgi:YfiH family protein